MKNLILIFVLILGTSYSFSQKEKDVKLNTDTNLIETTYYHDNGEISQKGTFDLAGKLHGEWVSYSETGDKVSMGSYERGIRTGKWIFWTEGNIKEVQFSDNVIASVVNTDNSTGVATKD